MIEIGNCPLLWYKIYVNSTYLSLRTNHCIGLPLCWIAFPKNTLLISSTGPTQSRSHQATTSMVGQWLLNCCDVNHRDHQKAHASRLGVFVRHICAHMRLMHVQERRKKLKAYTSDCHLCRAQRWMISCGVPAHKHINLHSLAWFGGVFWPSYTFILRQICFLGHLCRQSATAHRHPYIDIL